MRSSADTSRALDMSRRDVALALIPPLVWGLTFVVAAGALATLPPLLMAALRFLVVAPLALFVPRPRMEGWRLFAIGLSANALQFGFLFLGLAHGVPSGLAGILIQTQVLFSIVGALVVFRERIRVRAGVALALGICGIATIALTVGRGATLVGVLCLLVAGASWATSNLLVRAAGQANGFALTVWGSIVAPIPLFAAALVVEGAGPVSTALLHMNGGALLAVLYLGIGGTALGYGVWNWLLGRYDTQRIAPFSLLVPPIAYAAGIMFRGETLSTPQLVGGALLVLAAGTAVLPLRRTIATEPVAG